MSGRRAVNGALALVSLLAAGCATVEASDGLLLRGVHVVDTRSGEVLRSRSILVRGETIVAVTAASAEPPPGCRVIEGDGAYVVPGLWDMHVHSHRDRRAELHYPLYVAHGVTGVREMSTHLASALAARAQAPEPLAPRVEWVSPALDGAPPVLSHGLAVEDAAAAREAVALLDELGFERLKVYDRLERDVYFALADEARARGLALVGHVPLQVTPLEAARAGQRSIEHLTLLLEACIPGALEWSAADPERDSMALLVDGRLAGALERFDVRRAEELFAVLREHAVWQTPTLVQMRGAFWSDELAARGDPREAWQRPATRAEWRQLAHESVPEELAAGRAVFARQQRLVGELHAAGVGILAGTDTSDEPWVFAGSSLHDELELLVEAGLTPLEALRTATLNPARYRGDEAREGFLGAGATADLVLLAGDPTEDIAHLRGIRAVVLRGRHLDRAALDALIATTEARAAEER